MQNRKQSSGFTTKIELGKEIRDRRKSLKVTQDHFAELAGISSRTLRAMENGEGNPELDTLLKVCQVLGMDLKIEVIR